MLVVMHGGENLSFIGNFIRVADKGGLLYSSNYLELIT